MQLIEIIQLTLILFVVLSIIIFLFSYLGYRTKSKENGLSKTALINKKVDIAKSEVAENLKSQLKQEKPKEKKIDSPRFELFNPDKDSKLESEKTIKKKSHSPKTLIIKHKS